MRRKQRAGLGSPAELGRMGSPEEQGMVFAPSFVLDHLPDPAQPVPWKNLSMDMEKDFRNVCLLCGWDSSMNFILGNSNCYSSLIYKESFP